MTTTAQLAAQVTEVLSRWNTQQDQLADWLTGDPSGGPNDDGRYPLTDADGNTELFLSLPSLIDQVSGPAQQSRDAQAAAEAANTLAQAARSAADLAADRAEAARSDTTDLRNLVSTQGDDVSAKWSDVNFWFTQVSTAQSTVVAAEAVTLSYRDETQSFRDEVLVARDEAQTARDEAQGFAASVNPANLATKAELQSGLDGKLNLSGGTLTGNLLVRGTMNVGTNAGTQTLALGQPSESGEKRFRIRNNQWTTGTDLVVSSSSKNYGFYNRDRTSWDLLINGSTGAISGITSASIVNGLTVGGELETNGRFLIQSAGPTQWWQDTDHRSFGIHTNNNIAYFMRSSVNGTSWTGQEINGRWPLQMNLNDGNIFAASTIEAQALVTRDKITRSGQGAYLHYNTTSRQSGRITVSSANPSGGSNGDVWFQV